MMRAVLFKFFVLGIILMSFALFAAENSPLPIENWVFSGVVVNELGDKYSYFFKMQRQGKAFHSSAALFDLQTKSLLLESNHDAVLDVERPNHWKVGDAFLRFNPINETWIFGFRTADRKGFNFKVDMLKQSEQSILAEDLRPGLAYIIHQTGPLNGHILNGEKGKEQFVSSSNAWFRQIQMTTTDAEKPLLSSVLCRFEDESGFYAMNLADASAIRGAIAGLYDAKGISSEISQFVHLSHEADGAWKIHVPSPELKLVMADLVSKGSDAAGFVSKKDIQGFCTLTEDAIA